MTEAVVWQGLFFRLRNVDAIGWKIKACADQQDQLIADRVALRTAADNADADNLRCFLLQQESGCGTSVYAQKPGAEEPAKHGIWGIFEVFIDTIVLCTLTALVVLSVPNSLNDGMSSVIYSFSYFGEWGGNFVGLSSWIYALASVVCWSYYGISAMKYLTNKKIACGLYLVLYSAAGIIGSVFAPNLVWEISDITVSVMAIFNIICVLMLSKTVKQETERYFS